MAERRRKLNAGIKVKGRQAMGGREAGSRNKAARPKLTGERAGWTQERKESQSERNRKREWTPAQREEMARKCHRRACPVPGCMEMKAHEAPGCGSCGYQLDAPGHAASCGPEVPGA
jgi:hypothetical protein